MKKYILTKDYLEISETYGIFQNLSGDANIEITNNSNEQGILLKPLQKVTIHQKVYARKAAGGGTAQLMVLPFKTSDEDSNEDSEDDYSTAENYVDENFNRPRKNRRRNDYDYSYDWRRAREQPQIPPPPPNFPFPPANPYDKTPAVADCDGFYMLRIPKETLNGQNKFLVQINDSKGND